MKVTTVKYGERVVTTQYAYKELEMTATIQEGDNANECSRMLEHMVKSQLGLNVGVLNVDTKTTEKSVATGNTGGKDLPKQEDIPKAKKVTKAKAKKVTKAKAKKVTKTTVIEPTVEPTIEEVQMALRDVAVHFKDAAKAVAVIEKITGVKTVADVSADKYAEVIAYAKKVVAA